MFVGRQTELRLLERQPLTSWDALFAVVFEIKWSKRPVSAGLLRNAVPVLRRLETTVGLISRAGFRQPEAAMPDEAGLLLSADELVR